MTYKERIAWYLALQALGKLSRNRVAPAAAIRKKQGEPSGRTNSEATSIISRQRTPSVSQFIISGSAGNLLHYRSKFQPRSSTSDATTPVSPSSRLPIMTYYKSIATIQPVAKHDNRSIVTYVHSDTTRDRGVLTKQQEGLQSHVSVMPGRPAVFKNKSFAPAHAFPPPPQHVNGSSLETTQYATHYRAEMMPAPPSSEARQSNFELSSENKFNATNAVRGRDSVVDQDQALSSSNASASTLHLDGSSLGRWAIQHLEQVLSKPPLGMTGVDPRATVPRSRVAPF